MKADNEIRSTPHSKYRCQYRIVFAPKYRRQVIYREIKVDIGKEMQSANLFDATFRGFVCNMPF